MPVLKGEKGTGAEGSWARLRAFTRWLREDFVWWLPALPLLVAALVYYLSAINFQEWQHSWPLKSKLEIAHPVLLFVFLAGSFQGWRIARIYSFAWLTILSAVLFLRELHFFGTDALVYLTLILLGVAAYRAPQNLRALFRNRWASSLLAIGFFCYFCSQAFDRGLWKFVIGIAMRDPEFDIMNDSQIEESLETLGGFFLMLVPFTMRSR